MLQHHKNGFSAMQLVAVFAVLQLAVAFLTNSHSFTHEESMWHYIGRNWFRHGLSPYEGGIDNKSPLIFAVFGLSDILFGLQFWFPRILGIVVQSVGVYFVYKIVMQLSDKRAAVIAVTIYGLSLLWRTTGGKLVSFTETYAVTFFILSVYTYMTAGDRKKYFLSGLFAGVSFGWRISAMAGAGAIFIHVLSKNRGAALAFILGAATSVTALLLLAMMAGIDLHQLYIYAFADNLVEGGTADHGVGWRLQKFADNFIFSELVIFYPFVMMYLLMQKKYSLIAIWLVCEFIGINALGIYARPHFKHLLPVMSVMSGISISALVQRYDLRWSWVMVIVWILFFPKITEPFTSLDNYLMTTFPNYCGQPYRKPAEWAEESLGRWIRDQTKEDDLVLVAGYGARVQLFSERRSPTVYFNVTQTERAKRRLKDDLLRNKPAMVVVPLFPEYQMYVGEDVRKIIDELLSSGYRSLGCEFGYEVWVR